jgi:hypothetical protein
LQLHLRPGLLFILLREELRSSLSSATAIERLKASTAEGDLVFGRRPYDDRKFIGHVGPDSFEFRRDFYGRNVIFPVLLGELREIDGRLHISLEVGFYPGPPVAFLFLVGVIGHEKLLGVLLFGSLLLALAARLFALELKRSSALLREVLAAE